MLDILYNWGWIFFIYAFLGWIAEVAFAAIKTGHFVNRGFLNGPVCPIYGVGMMAVVFLLTPIQDHFLLLFAGGALVTSVLEYLTGFVLEKVFHDKWWDYSERRFNLHGYICLEFSLMWGFGCVLIMQNVHPLVQSVIFWLVKPAGIVIFWILAAGMAADICDTVSTILKLNRRLKAIDDTAAAIHRISDEIGERVAAGAIDAKETADDMKEKSEEFQAGMRERSEEFQTGMRERSEEFQAGMRERSEEFQTGMKEKSDELLAGMRAKSEETLAGMRERNEEFLSGITRRNEEYDRLVEKYRRLLTEKTRERRLLRAFPDSYSTRYRESFETLKEMSKNRRERKEKDSSED